MVLAPAIPVLSQVGGLGNALGALCRQVHWAQGAERRSQGLRRDGNSMGFPGFPNRENLEKMEKIRGNLEEHLGKIWRKL